MTTQIVYNDFSTAAIAYIKSPRVTSITYPSGLAAGNPAGGQTITINGAGFASGATVYIGSTIVPVITIVSSTQITFTSSATAAGSYMLYVYNLDGGTAVYPVGISFGTTPGWITAAGTLGTVYETRAVSFTLVAAALSTITYTLASGSLPPGATLGSSSGIISGTAQNTATSTTYTFTITARDTISQTANRTFSITISPDVVTWATPIANTTITVYEFGTVNQSLAATSAIGADITYTTSTLPYGVGLAGNLVAGSPNAVGTTVVTATATTANGRSATRNFTVTVLADSVTWTSPLNGNTVTVRQNSAYSTTLTATSAAGRSITYSAVNLPTGLSLTGAVVSGTPTTAANYTGSLVATAATTNRQTAITIYWGVYTVPDAPTIGVATKGGGSATVAYTQPAYNGNSPITSYTAVSSPGGITASVNTALSGSITVAGLTNGVSYTFSVYATNLAGNGASSGSSNIVVPNAAPSAPVLTASRISTTRVDIAFTAPNNNGATITRYTASTSPATVTQTLDQSGAGTFSFTVLSSGVNYTFSVYATNANGDGSSGTVSSYAATVPGLPTSVTAAAASSTSASVSFSAPSDTGGPAITSYTATSSPDNQVGTNTGSPVTVSNLLDGRSYSFSVYATNSVGSGSSATSNSITMPLGTYRAYFDGTTNTQLYVGDDLSFADSQDFTVECWAYKFSGISSNFWSIGTETTLRVQLQSNLFEVYGGFISKPYTTASINTWHHYAVARRKNLIAVYVDGSVVTSAVYSGPLGNTGPMYIGTRSNGNVNRLYGYMSNVRVVRGTALYDIGGFTPPSGNLGIVGDTTLLTVQNSYAVDNSNYHRGVDNTNVVFQSFAGY